MAQVNITDLNTPDVVKNLPVFHGNAQELNIFITTVNPVAALVQQAPVQVRPFWFAAIRNKIKGAASERLRLYGEPESWEAIRTCLQLHFTDHRDQRTLYNQLNNLKQSGNVQIFYDKILELVTALNDKARTEITNPVVRQATIDRHLEEGLKIFMHGTKDPLRTILLSRNPTTLNGAFAIAMQMQSDTYTNTYQPKTNFNQQYNTNRNPFNQQYNTNRNQFNPQSNTQTFQRNTNNSMQRKVEPMEVDQSTTNTRRVGNAFVNNTGQYRNSGQHRNFGSVNRNQHQFGNNRFPNNPPNVINNVTVEEIFANENFHENGIQETPP